MKNTENIAMAYEVAKKNFDYEVANKALMTMLENEVAKGLLTEEQATSFYIEVTF